LIPGRKYERVNVVAGYCNGQILAETCYTGTTTAAVFENWFVHHMLPQTSSGDVLIMDRASFHNKNRLKEYAVEYGVTVLFLPAYSPDFNPIEHVWANLKRFLANTKIRSPNLQFGVYWYFFLGFS
jgi:transposase